MAGKIWQETQATVWANPQDQTFCTIDILDELFHRAVLAWVVHLLTVIVSG